MFWWIVALFSLFAAAMLDQLPQRLAAEVFAKAAERRRRAIIRQEEATQATVLAKKALMETLRTTIKEGRRNCSKILAEGASMTERKSNGKIGWTTAAGMVTELREVLKTFNVDPDSIASLSESLPQAFDVMSQKLLPKKRAGEESTSSDPLGAALSGLQYAVSAYRGVKMVVDKIPVGTLMPALGFGGALLVCNLSYALLLLNRAMKSLKEVKKVQNGLRMEFQPRVHRVVQETLKIIQARDEDVFLSKAPAVVTEICHILQELDAVYSDLEARRKAAQKQKDMTANLVFVTALLSVAFVATGGALLAAAPALLCAETALVGAGTAIVGTSFGVYLKDIDVNSEIIKKSTELRREVRGMAKQLDESLAALDTYMGADGINLIAGY